MRTEPTYACTSSRRPSGSRSEWFSDVGRLVVIRLARLVIPIDGLIRGVGIGSRKARNTSHDRDVTLMTTVPGAGHCGFSNRVLMMASSLAPLNASRPGG